MVPHKEAIGNEMSFFRDVFIFLLGIKKGNHKGVLEFWNNRIGSNILSMSYMAGTATGKEEVHNNPFCRAYITTCHLTGTQINCSDYEQSC
jgi:hypothetical protein